jgi:hypothetical protein
MITNIFVEALENVHEVRQLLKRNPKKKTFEKNKLFHES